MWTRAAACATRRTTGSAVGPFRSLLLAGRRRFPCTSASMPSLILVRAASSSNSVPTVAEEGADSPEIRSISAAGETRCERISMEPPVSNILSLPSDLPMDLLSAPSPFTTSDTKVFEVNKGDKKKFTSELEKDIQDCISDLSLDHLKKIYNDIILPALELRCLVSPYSLTGDDAARLHHSYKAVIGCHPRYLTSLDLMIDLKLKYGDNWRPFLDYLGKKRLLVIPDWTKPLLTSSSDTVYDYGVIFPSQAGNEMKLYKCESDASVKGELAKISCVILHEKQVLTSEVYHDIPCEDGDSNQAEAFAMYFVLKRGIELGIQLHNVVVWTDNQLVFQIMTGARKITEDDKHRKLYVLLRRMRSQYKNLICIKVPREKLARAIEDWAPRFSGAPIFILSDHKDSRTTKLANQEMYIDDFHQRCYLEIGEDKKIDALWHISSALRAHSEVYVAIKDLDRRPVIRKRIMELFPEVADYTSRSMGVPLLKFSNSGLPPSQDKPQDLLIVYDATCAMEIPPDWKPFIIYLSTPDELSVMKEWSIAKYNPLSFISYHAARVEEAKQRLKDKHKIEKTKDAERQRFKRRIRKAKDDDKNALCSIRKALSVLTTSQSVREEIHPLLNSAMEKVELCISSLEKERLGGNKHLTREASDQESNITTLMHKVNEALNELTEIDNIFIQSQNHQRLLCSSKATPEMIAVDYIKEILGKGGIQDTIKCFKDRKNLAEAESGLRIF